MTHRSRIGVILLDYPEPDHPAGVAFWAAATGRAPGDAEAPAVEEPYLNFGTIGPAFLEVQRTGAGTPARIHLDIETDDVPAEVARLSDLGAAVVEHRDGYTILRDPGGLLFCVVPVQTGEHFETAATSWD